MKRKQTGVKSSKSKSIEIKAKKSLTKFKPKDKQVKKQQQPSLFVLVGDNFYVASSKTERKYYQQFEQKVKVGHSNLKKSKKRGISNFQQTINVQEYVKALSKDEKSKLLHDLQKEFESERIEQSTLQEQKEDKMGRLTEKLQSIKTELIIRWDGQIAKINHSFENEQIGLEEKNEKIILIQKIKNNKIAMINYTKVLFEKILRQEPDIELEKSERMQNIINSLNSISSMDLRDPLQLNQHQFAHISPHELEISANNRLAQSQQYSHNESNEQREIEKEIIHQELGISQMIKIEDYQKSQSLIKQSLKLDIRLDQIQFGKDSYEDQVIFSQHQHYQHNQQKKEQVIKLEFDKPKKEEQYIPIMMIPMIQSKEVNKSLDFFCTDEVRKQIPLLMTKDRLEQIQLQKSAKQIETLGLCIKERQGFQISQVITQNTDHFTTLIDVNQFIVQFYEFVMRNYMNQIIEGMNIPCGKSCVDKLYLIRQEGYVADYSYNNVLPEEYLSRFHQEMTISVRRSTQQQRIHNTALFHAFNVGLNVYRPYFELEGEVFPWSCSEKGLTFYQINEDNIEEVFQKSKMKILEYCASLCGMMVQCEVTTAQAKKLLSKRNEDVLQRVVKSEMIQKFGQWNMKKIYFQALCLINLCNQIFQDQIQEFCRYLDLLK